MPPTVRGHPSFPRRARERSPRLANGVDGKWRNGEIAARRSVRRSPPAADTDAALLRENEGWKPDVLRPRRRASSAAKTPRGVGRCFWGFAGGLRSIPR
jgi:hypothetical protein